MHALLSRIYYWPRMLHDVELYVKTCPTCQLDKTERKKEGGLLQPLPIPDALWRAIALDFISDFSEVKGMNAVFVIVDRFFNYVAFFPTLSHCLAEKIA